MPPVALQYAEQLVRILLRQRLSHRSICTADLTTGRGRLDTLVKSLGPIGYHAAAIPFTVHGRQEEVACDVIAARAALPVTAGLTDPLLHLSSERAAVVADLNKLVMPCADVFEPQPCHRISESEEAILRVRMYDSGMAIPIPATRVPRRRGGGPLVGGLFSVHKNAREDRLIFDRRPQNAGERRLNWLNLPSALQLRGMRLRPWQFVRASGDDLRVYYYCCRHQLNWTYRNAFGRCFQSDASHVRFGLSIGTWSYSALTVLAMGDLNSCDIAQAVHEDILTSGDVLTEQNWMRYGRPPPSTSDWVGLYLDDLLVLHIGTFLSGQRVPPVMPLDNDLRLIGLAEAAYSKALLERSSDKSFRFRTSFCAWGIDVDGRAGLAAAPIGKRTALMRVLLTLVRVRICHRRLLQRILGHCASVFTMRRPLMSVFHRAYKYCDSLDERSWSRLPIDISGELWGAFLMIPFASLDMRLPTLPTLWATDATPSAGGAAACCVPVSVAEEIGKRAEMRGAYVRLNHAEDFETTSRLLPRDEAMRELVLGLPWNGLSQYSFRNIHHVNLQESRAVKHELRRLVSSRFLAGCHQVVLCDSLVSVCAWAKGRSSSYRLNGILRSALPYLLLGNVILDIVWIDTHANPGDPPSRSRPWTIPAPLPYVHDALCAFQSQRPVWIIGVPGLSAFQWCMKSKILCHYYSSELEIPDFDDASPPCLVLWYVSKLKSRDPGWLTSKFEHYVNYGFSCALISRDTPQFWKVPGVQSMKSRLGLWFSQFVDSYGSCSVATNFPGFSKFSSWSISDLPGILSQFYATTKRAEGPTCA